jgi:hypothetical protein
MKLNRADHEILEQIDDLLVSENESVRELLQQAMVLHTLSRNPDDKLRDKVYGPFTKMLYMMQQMEQKMQQIDHAVNGLESMLRNQNHRTTGGYWTDSTGAGQSWANTNTSTQWYQGLSGSDTLGNQTSLVDQHYLEKLKIWASAPTQIKATTANDPDAMTLFDPDTGHKMYVK